VRLANAYAAAFTRYETELVVRGVQHVLDRLLARINDLRARGQAGSPAFESLMLQVGQLRDVRAQLANRVGVLQRAVSASSFRPHVLRNGLLGGALGALLGVAVAVGVAVRPRKRP
jgi:hypothetical protein